MYIDITQVTGYSVYCIMYKVHCTIYGLQVTVYNNNIQVTVYNIQCTVIYHHIDFCIFIFHENIISMKKFN